MPLYDDDAPTPGLTPGQKVFLFGLPAAVMLIGLLVLAVSRQAEEKKPTTRAAVKSPKGVSRTIPPKRESIVAGGENDPVVLPETLPPNPQKPATTPPEPWPVAVPKSPPTVARDPLAVVKQTVEKHFRKYANEPEGVEFVEWLEPKVFRPFAAGDDRLPAGATLIPALIRGKNSRGAKVVTTYLFLVADGKVVASDTAANTDLDSRNSGPLFPYGDAEQRSRLQPYRP